MDKMDTMEANPFLSVAKTKVSVIANIPWMLIESFQHAEMYKDTHFAFDGGDNTEK